MRFCQRAGAKDCSLAICADFIAVASARMALTLLAASFPVLEQKFRCLSRAFNYLCALYFSHCSPVTIPQLVVVSTRPWHGDTKIVSATLELMNSMLQDVNSATHGKASPIKNSVYTRRLLRSGWGGILARLRYPNLCVWRVFMGLDARILGRLADTYVDQGRAQHQETPCNDCSSVCAYLLLIFCSYKSKSDPGPPKLSKESTEICSSGRILGKNLSHLRYSRRNRFL